MLLFFLSWGVKIRERNDLLVLIVFMFLLNLGLVIAMENINQEYSADNNTVALFHFSENSGNIIHDAAGSYNGTCGSGVSWTNGKFGSAIHTDPSLGVLCDLDNLSFGNSMPEGTIELWFKADNEGFYGSLWGKEWGLYNRWKMYVSATNSIFEMRTGPPDLQSSIHDLNANYSFSAGNWYHIAGSWGPEGMRIYVNGYLLSSNSYSGSSPNTYTPRPFTIGQFYSYMGREVNFTGIIDELRVSNVSRIYTEPSTCTAYSYSTMWGSRGFGDDQFGNDLGPRGIDIDNKGYVYVADYGGGWIKKFTINGDYTAKWSADYISDLVYDGDFVYATNPSGYLTKYNINSSKIWEESIPSPGWLLNGVTIDSEGIVQVANAYDSKIYRYYQNGTYMSSWGVFGNGSGQINEPWSLAADK